MRRHRLLSRARVLPPPLLLLLLIMPDHTLAGVATTPAVPDGPPTIVFADRALDFELQRALGAAVYGGADANEVLFTARRITPGDDDSWYTEWMRLADRVNAAGEASLARGHWVSAREAFLRASMYYRMADFYLHGNREDPRILTSWRRSRDTFRRGAELLDHPVEVLAIPYEQTTLPGYFLRPAGYSGPRKTVIVQTGYDGTGEELFFAYGRAALDRGYNVLIFEGPGQGGVIREQGLVFRPDWERVVTPVVDVALARADVDPERLALIGESMGGYLAPRAAAFEHRLAAVVANGGVYYLTLRHGQTLEAHRAEVAQMRQDPAAVEAVLTERAHKDTALRWYIDNGKFTFGLKTGVEVFLAQEAYNLVDVAPKIRCPALIIDSADDAHFAGQPQMLHDAITGPKTLLAFSREDLASAHCQEGALLLRNQRIFDWLDETLGPAE